MDLELKSIPGALVCPLCHGGLRLRGGCEAACTRCEAVFGTDSRGFLVLTKDERIAGVESTSEEYAKVQEASGKRLYEKFLKPYLHKEPFTRVLDVGCGIGRGISLLASEGYEAYGVDIPGLSRFWAQAGNSPGHFFCCNSTELPFRDDYFDVVYSLGVIEHIGTRTGHCELAEDYRESRRRYAGELLRVTRPGGRVLVSCPNKHFPVDAQHGPCDSFSPRRRRVRNFIYRKTGMNIHPVWGRHHLLSYGETRELFSRTRGGLSFEPMPLENFFGFTKTGLSFLKLFTEKEQGALRLFTELGKLYISHLPVFLRGTFLNPYMLIEIRKKF